MVKNNPRISAPKLTSDMWERFGKKVNPETVRNVIRKAGYNGRAARKKPYISEVNRRKRLQFAKEYVDMNKNCWKDVLFSDETKINVFGSDGKVTVWHKANEDLKIKNLRPTVKHGGGNVMVWGCISSTGVGEMAFIDCTMKQEDYLKILKDNLHKSAENLGVRDSFKFYQTTTQSIKREKQNVVVV